MYLGLNFGYVYFLIFLYMEDLESKILWFKLRYLYLVFYMLKNLVYV